MSILSTLDYLALYLIVFFFFNDTATTEIYTLSLHDALPILEHQWERACRPKERCHGLLLSVRPNVRHRERVLWLQGPRGRLWRHATAARLEGHSPGRKGG